MSQQEQVELTNKQQEVLDSVLEQALTNVQNFEGIKSGIIHNGALALFNSGVKKSSIARLLVATLVSKDMNKKTQISRDLIYHVLRTPEFKALKSESHAKRRIGKGPKQSVTRFNVKSSNTSAPTCAELLGTEIKKIREQKPGLPNEGIRKALRELDTVKQYSKNTVRRVLATLIPVQQHNPKQSVNDETPTIATVPAGMTREVLDQEKYEQSLIEQLKLFQQIIEWLSGMTEGKRTQFYKDLPKGKSYTLALQEQCKDHIVFLIKKMPEQFVHSFLQYTDEMTHLISVWDEKLYEEKQLRESRRDMASR